MSEFPIHELLFEGPADLSSRTLQALRSLFLEDLKFSADDTQRYFKSCPVAIMKSEFLPELELFAKKIRAAGGKVSIRSPQKRKQSEAKAPAVAAKEVGKRVSFDTDESFWQADKSNSENVLQASKAAEALPKPLDVDLGTPLLAKPLQGPPASGAASKPRATTPAAANVPPRQPHAPVSAPAPSLEEGPIALDFDFGSELQTPPAPNVKAPKK